MSIFNALKSRPPRPDDNLARAVALILVRLGEIRDALQATEHGIGRIADAADRGWPIVPPAAKLTQSPGTIVPKNR